MAIYEVVKPFSVIVDGKAQIFTTLGQKIELDEDAAATAGDALYRLGAPERFVEPEPATKPAKVETTFVPAESLGATYSITDAEVGSSFVSGEIEIAAGGGQSDEASPADPPKPKPRGRKKSDGDQSD